MLKPILNLLGWIFMALAMAGLVLPLLPATPFALLAAACFARSSPQAYRRLMASPLLGTIVRDWQAHRGLRLQTKLIVFSIAAVAVAATWLVGAALVAQAVSAGGLAFVGMLLAVVPTVPTEAARQAG